MKQQELSSQILVDYTMLYFIVFVFLTTFIWGIKYLTYITMSNIDVSNIVFIKIIAICCLLYLMHKGIINCIDNICSFLDDRFKNTKNILKEKFTLKETLIFSLMIIIMYTIFVMMLIAIDLVSFI